MIYTIIVIIVSLLIGAAAGFYLHNIFIGGDTRLNNLQSKVEELRSQVNTLTKEKESALDEIKELKQIEAKYHTLSDKVYSLNNSVQALPGDGQLSSQIDQLEAFFDAFKTRPPQLKKTFKELRKMEESYYRIRLLHTQVMKPLVSMLNKADRERTDDTYRMLLAEMLEALWLSFDAVATLADPDNNSRPEQQLSMQVLEGTKTKKEAYDEAKEITTDPSSTPAWARSIHHTLAPLHIDSYPITFSGYKMYIPYK